MTEDRHILFKPMTPLDPVDWLGLCRRVSDAATATLERYPLSADRSATTGRGEGGDMTLVIDRAVEDAVFAELEQLGMPLTAVSEERGEVLLGGGGPVHVIIDPIDGSRNAKRDMPLYALSIAVASGPSMGDVEFGFVHDFGHGEDWWARRGEGAHLDGELLPTLPSEGELEMLGLETVHPRLVARWADALEATGAARLRALGSIALALCYVAAGRFDGLVSLGNTRSVDCAAGQLIVREAGGAVAFPDVDSDPLAAQLSLEMRSRIVAATGPALVERLLPVGAD
jgi:myo-inositol-1(or 4)-monophosphatase